MKLIQQFPQLAALAAVCLTLVACGGDDNKSSSSASSSSQLSSSVSSVASSLASSVASSTASSVAASVAPTPAPQIVLNEMRSDGGGYDYI